MDIEVLKSKLELLDDQIENVLHSGTYTELEIDKTVKALEIEKNLLLRHLDLYENCIKAVDAINYFMKSTEYLKDLYKVKRNIKDITVFNAEILSNNITNS